MEEIRKQVAKAQRRLAFAQFLTLVGWSLFGALIVAALALAVPRIWILEVDRATWDWSWLGGAMFAGLALAGIFTYVRRRTALEAAIEVDRRFGLKERVTSSLALTPEEAQSEAGQALLGDAVRRVERLDVKEKFEVRPTWRMLLPLVPAVAVFVLMLFVPAAVSDDEAVAGEGPASENEQIKQAAEVLKKKIERDAKNAEEAGLKDGQELFEKLEKSLNELAQKDKVNKKEALVKLNDLAKEIQQRRNELSQAEEMKKQLNQLNKLDQGPAEKMVKALKEGDLEKAAEEINDLKQQLEQGKLDEKGREDLAKQLEKMEQKLREQAQNREEAKQDLQNQIKQKMAEGDAAEAGKLQEQLNKLEQQQPLVDGLNNLANKLGQAAQNAREGKQGDAAKNLDGLKQDLAQMEKEMNQIQQLDEMLDHIAEAKQAMQCEKCGGKGCEQCQNGGDGEQLADGAGNKPGAKPGGQGAGKGNPNGQPGFGLGEGRGQGDRPEQKNDTKTYDSQVNAQVNKGAGVITDRVSGPNIAGATRHDVERVITAAKGSESDPLADQELPKSQREHARQYFDKFREGK